jgi:hypothetical protein
MEYVVSVGNIGNIECKTRAEANKTFALYVKQSKGFSGMSRAYMEDVCLMIDGEPLNEKDFSYSSYMIGKLEQVYKRKQREADKAKKALEQYILIIGDA